MDLSSWGVDYEFHTAQTELPRSYYKIIPKQIHKRLQYSDLQLIIACCGLQCKGGGEEIYTPWHNSVGLEKEHLFDLPIQ